MTDSVSYEVKKAVYIAEGRKTQILSSNYCYKFILIIGGCCNITFENNNFKGNTGDIIILGPGNKLSLESSVNRPLEIFDVGISLKQLDELSTEEINFINCLNVMPSPCSFINTSAETLLLLKNIATTLQIDCNKSEFAQSLYVKNLLSMFLILLIRSAIRSEAREKIKKRKHSLVDDLFIYIKLHITEEITLERLEKEFYVSRYHISREFKKHTGMTIHQYIVKIKLQLCKTLLEQGNSVVNVYKHVGLGGYNHMFRAFKKEFGITPMEYCKEIKKLDKKEIQI